MLAASAGMVPCGPAAVISMRYPSGGAFMTFIEAILPVAPGMFSITTGLPSRSLNSCPSKRATTSVDPPAGKPTTMVMVRSG